MMRSLYSGISGLRNHQTRMDVIGNNIANVNTVGFKSSRVIFQDIFSQTVAGGSRNTAVDEDIPGARGGTNPMQIGLGIRLSSIDTIHTSAPIQRTDNPFDMMINGDGFFIVGRMDETDTWSFNFTRAGNFELDNEGFLRTSNGDFVIGFRDARNFDEMYFGDADDINEDLGDLTELLGAADGGSMFIDGERTFTKIRLRQVAPADSDLDELPLLHFSVNNQGAVMALNAAGQPVELAFLAIANFSNPGGLEAAGNGLWRQTLSSGLAMVGFAQENGTGEILGGGLEMSNVDLANEFTDMIVTQRGFQANSRIITVSDTFLEELVNLKR